MHLLQKPQRSAFSINPCDSQSDELHSGSHPLQIQQHSATKIALEHSCRSMAQLFGRGFALNAQMDMAVFSKVQRHPGLRSSNIALETYLNLDSTVTENDYLNAPEFNEQTIYPRAMLEKQYGLM